jgi:hypothetical protein
MKIVKDTDIFEEDIEDLKDQWEAAKIAKKDPSLTFGEYKKTLPKVHLKTETMFEFAWKRLGESSDLFFCLEPE